MKIRMVIGIAAVAASATLPLAAKPLVWWTMQNDDANSWCQYAGGFEACFATDYSDGSKYTPEGMTNGDGVKTYADFPNIGGTDPDAIEAFVASI